MKNYILLIISLFSFLLETNCSSPGKADNGLGEEKASQKSIISFAFLKSRNPRLTQDYFAAVNQDTGDIALTIKQDSLVDTAELIATYTFAGSYVVIDSVVQQSGVTSNDFRKNKRYRVFSENGKYKDYSVIINFMLTYPYKPMALDVGIVGDLSVGKTIGAAYTFIDRNGEIEQDSVINWYFESAPYSGNYELYKTQTVTPSSSSNKLSDAKIEIPSGKEHCKIRLSVIPKSKSERSDSSVGYETKIISKSCIKAGFSESMIIINEVCTFTNSNSRNEYIILYNSSINDTDLSDCQLEYYDSEKAEWKLYCDFGDHSMFFKPEFFDYPALQLFTVKTGISAKGYYLVSRQETEGSIKRIADIVLKTDNTKDLLPDSGCIRLVKNSDVIDMFSYGMSEIYEGSKEEGTSLATHADGEILKRINNIDTDVSSNDIKPRPQLSPLSSGKNIVDTSYGPLITGRIKEYASELSMDDGIYDNVSTTYWLGGTADEDPKYTFHDWLYGGESTHDYNWIIYYINSSGQEVILNDNYPPGTPEDKKFNADSKGVQFEINKHDYELIPPGRQAKIRLKITPISFNPNNSKYIRGNEITFDYEAPVTLNVPAKAKITKFKPSTNQVEIFLERGGTLHNLYIGHVYPTPNTIDDPDITDPEILESRDSQIVSNLTQTYSTGNYLTIYTDGKGSGDVINISNTFNCSLFALRGGILEIKELKGWEFGTNREDPDFGYQDVILYGLGNHLSRKSLALKKYLVKINYLFRDIYESTTGLPKFNYASGIWKLQSGVAPFEAFPTNLSGDPVGEALEDMTDDDYRNALNTNIDYVKIPANINSYIIYRDNGDDVVEKITNPEDLSVDYYITTPYYEYVYNGSYYSIQLNNYKTMIEMDIHNSNIPLFTTTSNYLLCYAVYLGNSGNVTSKMSEKMTLGLSDPFINSNPDLALIFDYDVLPITFLTIGYTYIGLNWKNPYNNFYSTYNQFGPISTPNFAEQYPVPKFTDRVIHRKKESDPSATYVDTNSTDDFDISSAW